MIASVEGSCSSHRKLLMILFILLSYTFSAMAFRVTVNADVATGGTNYQTLNELLDVLRSKTLVMSSSGEDTVLFNGATQQTHQMSAYVDGLSGQLRFIGQETNPNKFHIINHSSEPYYNLIVSISISFERIIFEGKAGFTIGGTDKNQTFLNCVIRNFTSDAPSFIKIAGNGGSKTTFNNCLFVNNKFDRGIIEIPYSSPEVKIVNCTFHGNKAVLDNIGVGSVTPISIVNSIFSSNTSISVGTTDLSSQITYSLVPNATYTGAGNVIAADAKYEVATGQTVPTDWRPTVLSSAKGIGIATGAPVVDISGKTRADATGKRDAGCWDILDVVKITSQPQKKTVNVGDKVVFNVAASSASKITYAWNRVGGTKNPISVAESLVIASAVLSDDNSKYYCVVSDLAASVTSDTAVLRVYEKPAITDQPDTVLAYIGDSAAFSIAATGGDLFYTWKRDGVVIPGQKTTTLKIPNVAITDSGALIECVVSNVVDSVSSQAALLRVAVKNVSIVSHTLDTALMQGAALNLSVVAIGKPILVYSWTKDGKATELSATSSYKKTAVTDGDSGVYRCIVSNGESKDSVLIKIAIIPGVAPKIVTQSEAFITVKNGAGTLFKVTASGAEPLSYVWYKKNGASNDSVGEGATYSIGVTSATDSGLYFCVVTNEFGTDTSEMITLAVSSSSLFNPLSMECLFVDPTHVNVKVSNFKALPALDGVPPFADTIGLWYNALTIPSGNLTRTDVNLIKISLSELTTLPDDTYDTLVAVPGGGDECKVMYFLLAPLWKDPDTVISSVSSSQQAQVTMCASTKIENKLILTVEYSSISDSITVNLSNLTSINRDSLKSITIAYALANKPSVITELLPADLPVQSVDTYSKVIHDDNFAASEESLSVSVSWRGILGNSSNVITKKMVVGKPRPKNTATLTIDSATTTSVALSWQFSDATDFDSIRIVWGLRQLTPSTAIDGTLFQSRTVDNTVRSIAIDQLLSERFYYFGLQVVRDSVVSQLTNEAIASCSTMATSWDSTVNSIAIQSATFQPENNQFAINWTIDTSLSGPAGGLEAAVFWSIGTPPAIENKIAKNDYLLISDITSSNTSNISIENGLLFSATYHFALILRKKDGVLWTAPSDSSRTTVITGAPLWQKVTYFKDNDSIVSAFNNQVILKKSGNGIMAISDTLLVFKPDSTLNGFVVASQLGFDFKSDKQSDPIKIGLKYDPVLVNGRASKTIFMYQFNAVSRKWTKIEKTSVDTVAMVVSTELRPSDYPLPFILLIDTLPPHVEVMSDTISAVNAGVNVVDTLIVTDNISNCDVSLVYWGENGVGGIVSKPQRCTSSVSTILVTVPADSMVRDRGLRVEIIVTDGVSTRVYDVSRVVNRESSDPLMLSEMVWTPVMTTANLGNTSIGAALSGLSATDVWTYNPLQFRIMRWVDTTSGNAMAASTSDTAYWVEYQPQDDTLFSIIPGRVIWVKSRNNKEIKSLGAGTTVSVKKPYSILLKAQRWTDIALPFKMGIRLGDIFNATDKDENAKNNIIVINWANDALMGTITWQAKYIPNMPETDLPSTVLTYQAEAGGIASYSVFNNDTKDVELKIPAIPESFSTFKSTIGSGVAKVAKEKGGWSATIQAKTEHGPVAPVMIGSRPGIAKQRFFAPTSFQNRRMYLREIGDKTPFNIMVDDISEDGIALELQFENDDSQDAVFDCDLSKVYQLPPHWKVALFHPETGTMEESNNVQPIMVSARSKKQAVIFAGDSAYIGSQVSTVVPQLKLFAISPNPCRGGVTLRFTLPPADIKRIKLSLFDQLGRSVWTSQIQGNTLRSGFNTISWNMREKSGVSAGTYIIKLEAFTSYGKSYGQRQQRILYLP